MSFAPMKEPKNSGGVDPIAKLFGFGCLGLVAAVLAVVGFGWLASQNPERKAENEYALSSELSIRACERAVLAELKAPSTAKLSGAQASESAGIWSVTGSVDAENGFGAMLRGTFTCSVKVANERATVSEVSVR